MKHAVALVPEAITESKMRLRLERACAREGIKLDLHCTTGGLSNYRELFRESKNVISWNCRMEHWWMTRFGNNVLFVENSLLRQRAGAFVDHGGFWNNSNLCRLKTWEQDHQVDLDAFTQHWFDWGAMAYRKHAGPVLVCLQNSIDSNIRQQFPYASKREDKTQVVMEILYQHLPRGREVVIRPNPRFIDDFNKVKDTISWRDDWTLNYEESFHELLPKFSALVTVNSTCASEAVTFGMPVATLGTGAWSGSGATYECAHDPSGLAGFYDWEPDTDKCERYAKAVIGRHFMAYNSDADVPNIELERWLAACK